LYYDTFDWQLFRARCYLYYDEKNYILRNIDNDSIINKSSVKITGKYPSASNFPTSSFKNNLKNLIGIRALMPHFQEQQVLQPILLLNNDEKIVIRLFFQNSTLQSDKKKIQIDPFLTVATIRGYHAEEKLLLERIQDLLLAKSDLSNFQELIKRAGKRPLEYSSKIKIKLDREMTIAEAVRMILVQYVSIIKQNESGTREDIDTEFLHDFRVAIRRTRSLLSQTKNILPSKEIKDFRKRLAEVQKSTNVLRDLDVYLLKEGYYKGILPRNLSKSLIPLFSEIQRARKEEHRKVSAYLTTREYRSLLNQWSSYLKSDQMLNAPKAKQPVLSYAKNAIAKQIKIVLERGKSLSQKNPDDEQFHALRIDCKKLRYLLEFFQSLFSEQAMKKVITQLKGFQDLLGDYNDLSVQTTDLLQRLGRLKASDKTLKETSASLGGLMTIFYQKQNDLKKQFKRAFGQFSQRKQLRLYKDLFNLKIEGI
jgi:CHAD domain-containing protein